MLSCRRHQALPVLDTIWKELFGIGEQHWEHKRFTCFLRVSPRLISPAFCYFSGGYRITAIDKEISKGIAKFLHDNMVRLSGNGKKKSSPVRLLWNMVLCCGCSLHCLVSQRSKNVARMLFKGPEVVLATKHRLGTRGPPRLAHTLLKKGTKRTKNWPVGDQLAPAPKQTGGQVSADHRRGTDMPWAWKSLW